MPISEEHRCSCRLLLHLSSPSVSDLMLPVSREKPVTESSEGVRHSKTEGFYSKTCLPEIQTLRCWERCRWQPQLQLKKKLTLAAREGQQSVNWCINWRIFRLAVCSVEMFEGCFFSTLFVSICHRWLRPLRWKKASLQTLSPIRKRDRNKAISVCRGVSSGVSLFRQVLVWALKLSEYFCISWRYCVLNPSRGSEYLCLFSRCLLFFLFLLLRFSHQTQTTCWDHPKMTELYQTLGKHTHTACVWKSVVD